MLKMSSKNLSIRTGSTSLPITVTMATKQPHYASSKKNKKIRISAVLLMVKIGKSLVDDTCIRNTS